MVVAAVTTANLFNGLNTHAWTGWVWFAVLIGIILVWAYTVRLNTRHVGKLPKLRNHQAIYSSLPPHLLSVSV
jgi:hypothetical protein